MCRVCEAHLQSGRIMPTNQIRDIELKVDWRRISASIIGHRLPNRQPRLSLYQIRPSHLKPLVSIVEELLLFGVVIRCQSPPPYSFVAHSSLILLLTL